MSLGEAVRSVYTNYARFDGRASRSEYWWYQIFLLLVGVAWLALGVLAIGARVSAFFAVLSLGVLVFWLASIIPSLAVLCRRLHDSDHSGWWFWITLIPYLGELILLIFMVLPSTPGYNRYGSPAGESPADAFAEYSGWTRADALAQFAQDAQRAAASGFQPVHQEWQRRGNAEVLVVAYRRAYANQGWPTPPAPPWHGSSGGLG